MANNTNVLYYFTMIMSSIYIVLGLILLFAPMAATALPGSKHIGLGIMLILYAAYRFYRLKKLKEQLESDENQQ